MRTDAVNLIRLSLRSQKLDDAQLVWMLAHYGHTPGTVRAARYRMMKRGEVRFSRECRENGNGQVTKKWELAPNSQ
jgi:DNA-binding transcriptional regulator PaaX